MPEDYEVTVRVRLTVEDAEALLAAAGEDAPPELRHDRSVSVQSALEALVDPPDVERLPGVRRWSGEGWQAQVSAESLDG